MFLRRLHEEAKSLVLVMSRRQVLLNFIEERKFCTRIQPNPVPSVYSNTSMPEPEYDMDYLCNPSNKMLISENIKRRKGIGDIEKVHKLLCTPETRESLLKELGKIPNNTDPEVFDYGMDPRVLKVCGSPQIFDHKVKEFTDLAKKLQLIRTEHLGNLTGNRSYMLLGDLADLEEALVRYTITVLLKHKFKLVSVPDILPTSVIERCGMIVDSERTQVYSLDSFYGTDLSLSGTAEMSLAGKLMNSTLSNDELPLKLAAVSRCYRAETSSTAEERGIYRVHQFTKVEMFACCEPQESKLFLSELQSIEEELFLNLGLHLKILDMPPHELGAPAYRKLDVEGWLPGRKQFGELSSCSNCTDYQSRRLSIKYKAANGELRHVHTLNGTACAIPRMLIAICETHQTKDGDIRLPDTLLPYMKGKTIISKQPLPEMRYIKYKPKLN